MKTIFHSLFFAVALLLAGATYVPAQADPAQAEGVEQVAPGGPSAEGVTADMKAPQPPAKAVATQFFGGMAKFLVAPQPPAKAVAPTVPSVDTAGISSGPFLEAPLTLPKLLSWYDALYGALVLIWGFVTRSLGKPFQQVPKALVVAAGGAVLAAAFLLAGWSNVLPLLFAFLGAIGIYDIVLKPAQQLFKR